MIIISHWHYDWKGQ